MHSTDHSPFIRQAIQDSIDVKSELLNQLQLLENISQVCNRCIDMFANGNRLLIAGNGGSAADAQHIAAEFVCRFNFERSGLPAMALATNYSMITAAGNDYSFDDVFAREIEANGKAGDIFIGISTSGNSVNILRAIESCKKKGIYTVGLTGNGGKLKDLVDICLSIPSTSTPRIQESHILVGHIICEIVEKQMFAA